MTPDQPSINPRGTVDPVSPLEGPATVDATGTYQPAEASHRDVPAPPADAPYIPGYAITAEIARGGMGRVYAGRDLTLDREVAIKTLLPGANAERFVTEAKITARLPHPGIPPVHALGTLRDGSPYLAMKMIRGRTLADLLKARLSPQEEVSRFVQIVEQIAQAVGFAHAQGIIHRDLKPLNVMVGAFGEVQVMDWGLAKDRSDSGRESGECADGDAPGHTVAGAIMGTPGYMAPEQARGEGVDARADVFALGSILAGILTGRPAFVGTTARATIDQAARADLADVQSRLAACGADAELVAVARRCLAANAAERPADARAVAGEIAGYRAGVEARLRQAETQASEALVREAEQRKRRRQLLAAVGAVTLTLLAGLAVSLWQMNRANVERDAKTRALAAAIDARTRAVTALQVLTDEIVEKQMARETTLTEENKAFMRTILQQYEGVAAITADDAESRNLRALGLRRVGLMRYRLGELREAETAYTDCLALWKQLAADFPTRPDFRYLAGETYLELNNVLRDTGRSKEAETALREGLAIHKQLVADYPARTDFRGSLAQLYNHLGLVLRLTGQPKEAEAVWRDALTILEQLAADFPTRPDILGLLANTQHNLGIVLLETGRPKEAESAYRATLAIYKRQADASPTRPVYRHQLALSHLNLGLVLYRTGRLKEAEAAYADALAIQKPLAADFPTRPDFRAALGQIYNNLGIVLYDAGRPKEAEAAYADALAIQKQLVADSPNQPDLRNNLAGTCVNLAMLCSKRGNPGAAKGYLVEAGPHHAAALQGAPRQPSYRQFYQSHLILLTLTCAQLLEPAEAVRAAETIRGLGWNPPADSYNAACALSLCIPIVASHDKLDAEQRKEAVRFYGNEAMTLLCGAVKKGYQDMTLLKKDADLAELRQREDFQKLVADLEAQTKR